MTRKKTLIIASILLTIVIIIILLRRSKPVEKVPEEIAIRPEIPAPKVNSVYKEPVPARLSLPENKLNIPKTLKVYKLENTPFSEQQISTIARNLQFTSKPTILDDPLFEKTYLYSQADGSLRIVPEQRIIDLKTRNSFDFPFASIPEDDELKELALNFLLQQNLIDNKESLEIYKIRPLGIGEGGHIEEGPKPNVISVSFIKKIDGYPILAPTHETGIINVMINSRMQISSVYFDDIPSIKESVEYPTKTYSEIIQFLQTATTLQSLNDGKIELLEIPPNSVKNVNIDKIEVAYLQELDSKQEFLQPVFLLYGTAQIKGKGSVTATLYMPAIARDYLK